MSTQHIPSAPRAIKTLQGFSKEFTNPYILLNHVPSCFGIHDEAVPNAMFNPHFMPLHLVEDPVVPLDLDGPKGDPPKEMPNFRLLRELPGDPFHGPH